MPLIRVLYTEYVKSYGGRQQSSVNTDYSVSWKSTEMLLSEVLNKRSMRAAIGSQEVCYRAQSLIVMCPSRRLVASLDLSTDVAVFDRAQPFIFWKREASESMVEA